MNKGPMFPKQMRSGKMPARVSSSVQGQATSGKGNPKAAIIAHSGGKKGGLR